MEVDYRAVPFDEAITFFRQKINIPTESYRDLERNQHDWAFAVAGATKAQLVADLREAVDKAIATGSSLDEFRRDFDEIVARHGWAFRGSRNWRTNIILNTNIRTAYAAGRYQQMTDPETLKDRPYWEYKHGDSRVPRPLHLSWDGLVLRADDPWWDTHYPPCGWGCRCRAFALSKRDLERLGKKTPDQAPDDGTYEVTDRQTGEVQTLPRGIDPGWDYTPGKSTAEDRTEILTGMLRRLPQNLRDQAVQEIRGEALRTRQVELATRTGNEKSYVLNPLGFELLAKEGPPGVQDRISYTPSELALMPGSTQIHNHLGGGSFSVQDLRFLAGQELAEMRVVGRRHLYIARPAGLKDAIRFVINVPIRYASTLDDLRQPFIRDVESGKMSKEEAGLELSHLVVESLSREFGFFYERTPIDG